MLCKQKVCTFRNEGIKYVARCGKGKVGCLKVYYA